MKYHRHLPVSATRFIRPLLLGCLALWTAPLCAVSPYAPDANTLHLWHLNESVTPATNALSGGISLEALANGATLGNASFAAGTEFEFIEPVRAGDTIRVTAEVRDVYAKTGRSGMMVFAVYRSKYTNQRGATGTPNRCQYPACALTVSCSDKELPSSRTAASAMP